MTTVFCIIIATITIVFIQRLLKKMLAIHFHKILTKWINLENLKSATADWLQQVFHDDKVTKSDLAESCITLTAISIIVGCFPKKLIKKNMSGCIKLTLSIAISDKILFEEFYAVYAVIVNLLKVDFGKSLNCNFNLLGKDFFKNLMKKYISDIKY